MFRELSLALGLCVAVSAVTALTPAVATAASISPQTSILVLDDTDGSLVQRVQGRYRDKEFEYGRFWGYYNRCHYRAKECARRWGKGTRRYRNCLYWQACRYR